VTESAISQRFTPECANLFLQILHRLAEVQLSSDKVNIPLLKQFFAVIVEDSTSIVLPAELGEIWKGCGGSSGMSDAAVKAFVRWDVLKGALQGPELADGRTSDHKTPFSVEDLPEGSLYIADLGFFAIERLCQIAQCKKGKRYFVSRLQAKTNLYNRHGCCIDLKGILPQQVGHVREVGVVHRPRKTVCRFA
jgi:hypothetical protein